MFKVGRGELKQDPPEGAPSLQVEPDSADMGATCKLYSNFPVFAFAPRFTRNLYAGPQDALKL